MVCGSIDKGIFLKGKYTAFRMSGSRHIDSISSYYEGGRRNP